MSTFPSFPKRADSHLPLHLICTAFAVILGLVLAYADRYAMWPDGINYLDMGDAYLRGDWKAALNGLWSPLYSWILALAMLLFKPSIYWEFPVVHAVNFVIYLTALASFQFFLHELVRYGRSLVHTGINSCTFPVGKKNLPTLRNREHCRVGTASPCPPKLATDFRPSVPGASVPENSPVLSFERFFLLLSYALFVWSSIKYISLWIVTPDMLISAYLYCISAMLLRIRMGRANMLSFCLLGAILGLSYLTKTFMLPMTFVFLGIAFIASGYNRVALRNTMIAFGIFLLISGPFVLALSQSKGYFTFGDSGKLNYAWHVNGIQRFIHWQGDPAGGNMPKHPTRIIFDSPTVYEFAAPVGGSYPPFYDPSYWYEGVTVHHDLKMQITAFFKNGKVFIERFFILQSGIIICALSLFCVSRKKRDIILKLTEIWFLVLPPSIALFLYLLVHLEQRYFGGYNVIFWCSILLAMCFSNFQPYEKSAKRICVLMLAILCAQILGYTIYTVNNRSLNLDWLDNLVQEVNSKDRDFFSPVPTQVADYLRRGIVEPGDKVACIERLNGMHAFWAHLARVRIVAEIQGEDVEKFWEMDDDVKSEVIAALGRTGAKILVFQLPDYVTELGNIDARRIENTRYYFMPLKK